MINFVATLWVIGTVCMTLDFLRIYFKALSYINSLFSSFEGQTKQYLPEDEATKFNSDIKQNLSKQRKDLFTFVVGLLTMFVLWPIALLNLLMNEKQYEARMIDLFSKPFQALFVQAYSTLQVLMITKISNTFKKETL